MSSTTAKRPKPTVGECQSSLSAVEDALYVIGGKWKIRVIVALKEGEGKRFNELQRTIKGISARVLSNELKELELNGFVKRTVHAKQIPVVVEYLPTEYCETLGDVIGALAEWGKTHRRKIRSKA